MKAFMLTLVLLVAGMTISAQNTRPVEKTFSNKKMKTKVAIVENRFSTSMAADASERWLNQAAVTINFKSKKGIVTLDFSALARALDNHMVLQIRLDGQPMYGHSTGYLTSNISEPIVSIPDVTDQLGHFGMVSYNFFGKVKKNGKHKIELFFAGCCSPNNINGSGAKLLNPVFVIQYPK